MELKNTVEYMTSKDYKDRFRGEYFQLSIRIDKLVRFIGKLQKNEVESASPVALYMDQLHFMKCYKEMLETRAKIEEIELEEV